MTYVVTENCQKCKFTDCVEVCPVDCFYEGEDMLYINPDECIDCGACEPICPVKAIYADGDLPDDLKEWAEKNVEGYAALGPSPVAIIKKQDPLPTAEARKAEIDAQN